MSGNTMNIQRLLQDGLQQQQAGNFLAAATLYRRVLKAAPRNPHANYLLGVATAEMGAPAPPDAGQRSKALALIARAIELGLEDAGAYFYYAKLLLLDQQNEAAIAQLTRAIERKADFIEAREMLGNVLYELARYGEAEATYRNAIIHAPGRWALHFNLGHALYQQERYADAIQVLDRAAGLMPPDKAGIYAMQALLFELANQLAAAADKALQALALAPGNPTALLVQAKLARRAGDARAALAILDRTDASGLNPREHITYWSERGRLLDSLENFGEAFEAFEKSKTALAAFREIRFEQQPWDDRLSIIEHAAAALKTGATMAAQSAPRPIFILGFHRSGTTLVEQMLSSHPNIAAGGELELIWKCEEQLVGQFGEDWPAAIDSPQSGEMAQSLAGFRQHYIEQAKARSGWAGEAWFTDKSPLNSAYLLTLRLLFPDAPVLRVVRHPLDIALSCYLQIFQDRNEWSYRLGDIAWLYARLHRHLRAMAPVLGTNYVEVRYEALVNDPEAILRDVLEQIGAPWDPACLRFYENKRVAHTASYAQVTQKLYDDSIDRHLNYAAYFDQATLSALREAIAELGYAQLERSDIRAND